MWYLIIFVISYLIGSVNFSILISKKIAGYDIRTKGSGNAGSTNILRNLGKGPAILTVILDILKGVVSILIAYLLAKVNSNLNGAYLVQIAGLGVAIGHCYPLFYDFRGGKGVATSLGVLLMLNWKIRLICLIFALCLMVATKMVSLGSVSAAILYPILTIFIHDGYLINNGTSYSIFAIMLAALVIFKHRENIKRIIEGKESKLSFKK